MSEFKTIDVSGFSSANQLADYLPSNYFIDYISEDGLKAVVRGIDNAGWTAEDYVIPRLGSGLIVAKLR